MATYTAAQLATATLREMGIIAADESASSDDSTYCTDAYGYMLAELASHGNDYVYWLSGEIPASIFLILRDMLILEVCGAFGQAIPPEAKDIRRTLLMKRLRRHMSVQSNNTPTRAEYF